MISGAVTSDLEAIVDLAIVDAGGARHQLSAMINTGYTGWLTLPPSLISAMDLPWREVNRAIVADGRAVLFDVYSAQVEWDGNIVPIKVHELDAFPLIGNRLLEGYELILPVEEGTRFTLRRMKSVS
jgi:clan AA aspartic protease